METHRLIFLKLGGSLITDKDRPFTPRPEVIERLAVEISQVYPSRPGMRLVLGHGSGSFGHTTAQKHGTRSGVRTPEEWLGFVEVWKDARALNEIVLQALLKTGLPVMAFPPSASVIARGGQAVRWELSPIQAALTQGIIPLIYGDVIFDEQRGGTILSTEDLFIHLASALNPARILLAGLEPCVWADFPTCKLPISELTPQTFASLKNGILGSASVDVTGGMLQKVKSMLTLTQELPGLTALIFSGEKEGQLRIALEGENPGTLLKSDSLLPSNPERSGLKP